MGSKSSGVRAFLVATARSSLLLGVFGFLVLFASACGDSANNNQGVTFTALGWFADTTGDVGQNGIISPASDPGVETTETNFEDITSFIGLQNNFSDQFIRTTQIHHEYYIPGASVQPPPTAFSFTTTMGPQSGNAGADFGQDGTLPDSFDGDGSTSFNGVVVVSSDVRAFVNFNRESMPELPFNMLIESYVTGVTSSGQSVSTNKVFIEVIFTNDVVVPPTDGTNVGAQTDPLAGDDADTATTEESTVDEGLDDDATTE